MRQLSEHDAAFLFSDSAHANSNVTLLHIYDQSTAPGGRVRFKDILAHIEGRLHLSPIFRQKLKRLPFDFDFPYWVEDENFDLEFHVRHIALPKPGDWRQFCIQVSRIHARPLDLNRPLWEIYVIEGLDTFVDLPPGSFALVTKIHHAALDVEEGSEITSLLHDTTPTPHPPEPPEPWFPETPPGEISMMARGLIGSVWPPSRLVRPGLSLMRTLAPMVTTFVNDVLNKPSRIALTRFNAPVSPYRAFETRRFPLAEFKRIRDLVPGARINDAVLAVCGGALRHFLDLQGELPEASLWSMAPIYMRDAEAEPGTRREMAWIRVQLGTHIADPVERLRLIHEQTESELMERAVAASELTDSQHHASAATLAFTSKFLTRAAMEVDKRAPRANCTITNVPGPGKPLYLNGARMTYFSAIMPITDGLGLVFAVTSYDGKIIISPTFCREQMPEPEVFAQAIRDSFQEYLALTEPVRAKRVAPRKPTAPAAAGTKPRPATPRRRKAAVGADQV
ncbi:wax ester/triacylglycerol synthase family O-acyltransferase [Niveibacterium sp. 24ML]|uniref:wax ester/triacylglycerol synthase family O-acyltransferase n=1 Tax=Niveibacterium sp. 24ML TaxID=2985512 RepID=UPI0022711125|nr:wax ester/triacylglycerol synthase family O-acyltransferase [Niveibacterium sp. 24ML]MCX9157229.1 wax ester/triacylglycerol synthase family O-acyltransferase [Niveibacterium sp. 24ML]